MGDLVPFPAPNRDVFIDGRGEGRVLRASWHPAEGMVVLSLWEWDHCRATFRLSPNDVPDLIAVLAGGLPEHAGPPQAAAGGDPGWPGGFPAGPPFGQPPPAPPTGFADPFGNATGNPPPMPGGYSDQFGAPPAPQVPPGPGEPVPVEAPFFTAGGFQAEQAGYPAGPLPPGPGPDYAGSAPTAEPAAGPWPPPPAPAPFPAGQPDLPPPYRPEAPAPPVPEHGAMPGFDPGFDQHHGYPPGPPSGPSAGPPAAAEPPAWDTQRDYPAGGDRPAGYGPQPPVDHLGPRTGHGFPAVDAPVEPPVGPTPPPAPFDPWAAADRPAGPSHDRDTAGGAPSGATVPASGAGSSWGGGSWGGGSWGGGQSTPPWEERGAHADPPVDRAAELEATQFHPGPDYDAVPDYPPAEFTGDPRHQPVPGMAPRFPAAERDRQPDDGFVFGRNHLGQA